MVLNVIVLEAEGLEAKDANGKLMIIFFTNKFNFLQKHIFNLNVPCFFAHCKEPPRPAQEGGLQRKSYLNNEQAQICPFRQKGLYLVIKRNIIIFFFFEV